MSLALSDVTYTYPDAVDPVISHVSLTFDKEWTAVLGDNGCGKTTLAKLAGGLLQPDSGTVTSGLFCVYCAQQTVEPPAELTEFALSYDKRAVRLREALALDDDMAWRYEELSCGQRKKLQVAVALWETPDVLILDEPTNHLDHDARMQLADILRGFDGVGILVSHDRELLEALSTRCVSFEGGGVVMRNGGFSDAVAQAGVERTTRARERATAKRELARLSAEADARAHQAARADARLSKRHIDPKDHSAKEKINLAVYSGQDGARGKIATQMDARLEAASQRVERAFVEKRYDGDIWFDAVPAERKVLVRVPAGFIAFGAEGAEGPKASGDGRPSAAGPGLSADAVGADAGASAGAPGLAFPDLYVGHTDHIGIVGPNGAGKSTLVRHLRALAPGDLEVLYIPQELSSDQQARVIGQVQHLDRQERGRVLSTVAQLNSRPDAILEGGRTSPGEMRKLMLAMGILRNPVLIIMDEPTNHLDLHSVEALERALSAFPGALALVSHDLPFLSACTTCLWEVRDGRVRETSAG